jgi:hypothetical protein
MNIKQKIALLESAKTDIVGGDSWLGIIDECTDIPDYIEKREYEQAEDSLITVEYLWRQMYPKLECLIYDPVTPSQEQCDKVSHDCHIEHDTLSHPVYRSCHSCRLHRINDGENFCDYISRPLYWLAVYCKYWE